MRGQQNYPLETKGKGTCASFLTYPSVLLRTELIESQGIVGGKRCGMPFDFAMNTVVRASLTQQSSCMDGVAMPQIDFASPDVTRVTYGWLLNEVMVAGTLDRPQEA
jgi:hypothetical protein